MSNSATPRLAPNKIQRWLALPCSVALGGLLVAAALISLGARSAAAAGLAEPAVSYPCSEAGLNSALAAGGSATFSCPAPHTVTVSAVKVVNKNVSLDGGNKLILSGGGLTGVFTVATGVHLNLINLTLRDASQFYGGAVYNSGFLAVTHTQFISNFAGVGGAAVFNAPGAQASIAGSTIVHNISSGGAVWNGGIVFSNTVPATVTVSASTFESNTASEAAAIFNQAGLVSVSGSTFRFNLAAEGGAIFNFATLQINSSQFDSNSAGMVLDSQAAALGLAAGLSLPDGLILGHGGGAIYAASNSQNLIATSTFTGNSAGVGGAIFNTGLLTVNSATFIRNAAFISGNVSSGGAIYTDYPGSVLTVGNSAFTDNQAFEDGGAIFNGALALATVGGSDFTHNTAVNDSGSAVASWGVFTVTNSVFTGNYGAPGLGVLKAGGGAIFSGPAIVQAQGPGQTNGPNGWPPLQAPAGPGTSNRLYIDHVRFISNSSEYAGGAIDAGVTAINASTFSGNTAAFGGALDVLADNFVISGSTFTNNAVVTTTQFSAWEGGAIDTNANAIKVTNSTFYGNRVPAGATGRLYDGEGGAIQVQGGFAAITNSTFLSNTAGDAGFGGAFADNAHLIAHNLLIAFNAGGNCQTSMTLTIHDIDYPGASCSLAAANVDPRALAPANNGGPTLTSALLPGSPAINGADNATCPSTDQRGAKRPVGGTCDIGAFEFGGSVPWLWLALVRR